MLRSIQEVISVTLDLDLRSSFNLLGIGADNVFIFVDTWKASGYQNHPTPAHQMSAAYRKASLAMFFTTTTTMAAFLVSAFSPFIGKLDFCSSTMFNF